MLSTSRSSLTAPWKSVPSEKMVLGLLRRAMNRRSDEMIASVMKLVSSNWLQLTLLMLIQYSAGNAAEVQAVLQKSRRCCKCRLCCKGCAGDAAEVQAVLQKVCRRCCKCRLCCRSAGDAASAGCAAEVQAVLPKMCRRCCRSAGCAAKDVQAMLQKCRLSCRKCAGGAAKDVVQAMLQKCGYSVFVVKG